jgi:magnesium chelatase accessory protein
VAAGAAPALDADWPQRRFSEFVEAAGLRWHVQRSGSGPPLLLVHGTGASVHSWRALAPWLSRSYAVLAMDLPGHGYTQAPAAAAHSLDGMARAVRGLLQHLRFEPRVVVGHSAGAAILARGCLDALWSPDAFVSLCGALLPLDGLRHPLIAQFARGFVGLPFVPELFAWRAADPTVFASLMAGTGSSLDEAGLEYYRRLAARPSHVAAALNMMAHWDVRALEQDLPRLRTRLCLVAAERDGMIPVEHARGVQRRVRSAEVIVLPGVGHLAHEETPDEIGALIDGFARRPQ